MFLFFTKKIFRKFVNGDNYSWRDYFFLIFACRGRTSNSFKEVFRFLPNMKFFAKLVNGL